MELNERSKQTAMYVKNLLIAAGALAILTIPVLAQGPLYDKVIVDLPYSVTIGNKVLQPGNYVIRQNPSEGGGGRVLLIYSDKGRHFETSTMTIAALDNLTPKDTKVVLHRFGNDYFFDKIWIQGKNYGYEFPLPESVKSRQRERMQPVNVAARYESTTQQVARNETRNEATEAPAPPAAPAPAPAPEERRQEVAQAAPPPPPAPATAPAPVTRKMPHTDAGWMTMLLSGGLLSAAGLVLRRRA
jgi:hypothetical protein